MTRNWNSWAAAALLTCAAAGLSACGREEAPEPAPTESDGPRSIFEKDGEGTAGGPAADALPPLETTLGFPDGTSDLTEAARAELATILKSPQMGEGGRILLGGHSDTDGSDEANETASQERAEAVRDFLVENGVAEERIEIIAFGEQNPVEPNALPDGSPNEEGRAANRRVEVKIETKAIDAEETRAPTLIETITQSDEAGGEESSTNGE
ncbi:OmpA family protein [Erythrobacter aquimaris]|uniref:OmpA family protein n=1 Tax=Qipengyuania aquimaris TaxID=255984 RepID=A0A6I4TPD2_9SPHN|nr:OmpA family protein [Qipengyuania aquimaris]MXO97020.1 OmpA family protein [Qipengyuania aquimaris]